MSDADCTPGREPLSVAASSGLIWYFLLTICALCLQATTLYCLVTEYANGGELLAYIKSQKEGRLAEDVARPFVRQLVSALYYIHERGIVHRSAPARVIAPRTRTSATAQRDGRPGRI